MEQKQYPKGPAPKDPNDYEFYGNLPDDVRSKIKQRRAQMMVHSYIYYKLGKNIVSDQKWDRWAKELVDLQEEWGHKIGYYDEDFEDFTGATGMHLPKNKHIQHKAQKVLRMDEQRR